MINMYLAIELPDVGAGADLRGWIGYLAIPFLDNNLTKVVNITVYGRIEGKHSGQVPHFNVKRFSIRFQFSNCKIF